MATPSLGLGASYGKIRRLSMDQHHLFFTVAGEGFRLLRLDDGRTREEFHLDFDRAGPIDICESVEGCNVAFVVPANLDDCPKEWADRTNRINCQTRHWRKWNDHQMLLFDRSRPVKRVHPNGKDTVEWIGSYHRTITFDSKVLAVRCSWKRVAAGLINTVHVFDIDSTRQPHLHLRTTVDTRPNPKGLLLLSPFPEAVIPEAGSSSASQEVLVFPGGSKKGMLQVVDMAKEQEGVTRSPVYISAHENELQCISINSKSTLLATASERGTLIRIFDLFNRQKLVELRRGADQAIIHCISFSRDSKWLCCSSDKGTVHVFALQEFKLNRRSRMAGLVPNKYTNSQWSCASFTVDSECACICTFGQGSGDRDTMQSVVVLSYDGKYNRFEFKVDGSCSEPEYDMFMQCETECKLAKMARDLQDL